MITRYYIAAPVVGVAAVLVEEGVQGAALIHASGLWEGRLESCTIVEIVGSAPRGLADTLRAVFNQDSVLRVETQATYQYHARPNDDP
jgi:hypothetical protein